MFPSYMAKNKDFRSVDLTIYDRDLEEIMLASYPIRITKKQHIVDTSESGVEFYRFFNLKKRTLLGFLTNYKDRYEYEVRDSNKGKFIEVNKLNNHPLGGYTYWSNN